MKTDLSEIRETLQNMLTRHTPPLRVRRQSAENFEVAGTKETMQGKQKVDGYYFASVMPKSKDVRFYYFPIYTHADQFAGISEELRKCLKGKSCFHIKKLSPGLESEITEMIEKGVAIYLADGLI
ncbi:MAG TPA: hypothetical protein PKV71_08565 [Calditrichia bacterium]|nr:hypothetical protein [Calditrichota bacterium]HQU74184.1 hypothetical protein [Calditrichia bacterium]HQV31915.1 hypothetical protein [Calditrichia bacterium]